MSNTCLTKKIILRALRGPEVQNENFLEIPNGPQTSQGLIFSLLPLIMLSAMRVSLKYLRALRRLRFSFLDYYL